MSSLNFPLCFSSQVKFLLDELKRKCRAAENAKSPYIESGGSGDPTGDPSKRRKVADSVYWTNFYNMIAQKNAAFRQFF